MNTELLKSKLLEAAFNGSLTHADTSKWKHVKLEDVCMFDNGYAFKSNDYQTAGVPLIRISNICNDSIDLSDAVYIQGEYPERFVVHKGDLLIAMSGATTGKMGIYALEEKAYLNQRVGKIRIIDEQILMPGYRNYFLRNQTEKILDLAYGAAQPNISAKQILDIVVPLPPLAEQQQIVAALEEGFAAIDAIAEAKENLSTTAEMLRSKILQAAFDGSLTGDDVSTWKWMPMKKVTTLMCDGDWIEKKDQSDSGIRLVQTGNVGNGRFIDKPNSYKYISEDTFKRLNCTEIFPGDILISRLPSPVGRACELPEVDYRMITAVDCTIIRLNDSILKPLFLYYTQSPTYHYNMAESNFITGTTRARISRSNLEKMPVPVPPLAEQKRIVAKIEELFAEIDKLTK